MSRHAFIVGGTGQIGRAVADRLLRCGWSVTLSCRGLRPNADDLVERGAKVVNLDREVPGALAKAVSGGADAVIDTVAFSKAHAAQLLELAGHVGSFVVISSSSVYRDDQGRTLGEAAQFGFPDFPEPIKETQRTIDPGLETYSSRKVEIEHHLLDHARNPVTIVRPCAIHGPHSTHPREWWFVKRMLDNRPKIPLAYGGQSRFHTSAVKNIASLIGTTLKAPETRIFNAADPEALTVAEIGAAIAKHLGFNGELVAIDSHDPIKGADVGWSPWAIPSAFTLDTTAATKIGYQPVATYEASVKETCDWLIAHQSQDWKERFTVLSSYSRDFFDYLSEDRYFAAVTGQN